MNRLAYWLLAGLITCTSGACMAAQGQPARAHNARSDRAFQARVSAYATRLAATYRIPGLAVLVQRDGRTIASANVGNCNAEYRIPVTDRCVFHLASSSKLFGATAIMRLAQEGRLRLDDPVSQYVDGLPESWRSATVRQLVNLTSGIPNFFGTPEFERVPFSDRWNLTPQQLIAFAAPQPMNGRPGERWAYAQTGPMLAGLVVERVTGRPFQQHLRESLFQPLGMTQTAYGDSTVLVGGRSATAYRWINGELRLHFYPVEPPMYPASGLNSSVHDLARFFAAIGTNRLLSDASKAEMWEPVRVSGGDTHGYAFGWVVGEHNGVRVVEHSGAGSVWLGYVPDQKLTILFLTNLNGVEREFEQSLDPHDPLYGILDLYRGA